MTNEVRNGSSLVPAPAPAPAESTAPARAESTASAPSFDDLYEQHFDFVWRSVRYLGVPDASLDDAVQDVFVVAHRRLADFESRSSPRTWLFAIALRVVSDYRRSRKRRGRLAEELGRVTQPSAQTPFDAAAQRQARELLLLALQELPEDQRAVFVLAEIEEQSAPEISSALDVKLNTVYSRLRSARRAFEEIVAQYVPPKGSTDE